MQRRRFFSAVAGVFSGGAVSTVLAGKISPDTFPYRSWKVQWTGWQQPPGQFLLYGLWLATHPDGDKWAYATTHGVLDDTRPGFVFDLSSAGGVWLFPDSTESDKAAKKAETCQRLLSYLDSKARVL